MNIPIIFGRCCFIYQVLIKEADILTAYESDYSQENADICYLKLALNNDYESFWNRVYSYADKNIKS